MSTRREFLVASAAVLGGVLGASLVGCGGGGDVTRVQADVAALLPEGAATVGKAWKKLDGDDDDPGTALFDDLAAAGVDVTDNAALGAGLRRLILDDFAQRRTAEVKGWVLSVSECRLCALAA
ncbi:MAG: hypothetical protein GY898_29110 [Proteobacteria bacterium]|nr:hypothetical protein [Pseudomonadota bacterium]